MMYVSAAGGLVLLLICGDVLVRGAVTLAERMRIPQLVIGLTVVAFGTSAPELMVSLKAALSGVPAIAIGNVVGSNIANILLVLGLPALIFPIVCEAKTVGRDSMVMLAVSVAFILLCWWGEIGRIQGVFMFLLLLAYLIWSYVDARRSDDMSALAVVDEFDGVATRPASGPIAICFVIVGIIGLVVGARLLIDGATQLARDFGVSDAVIGLTLVAIGTSLPELATSLIAAMRRHGEVAIGNVIGSNLFNILAIMGITSTVIPIPVPPQFLSFDLWVMLAATAVLTFYAVKCKPIARGAGIILFMLYVVYVWSLFAGFAAMAHPPA